MGGRRIARCAAFATTTLLVTALGAGTSCAPAREPAPDVAVSLAFDPEPHVGGTTCTVRLADGAGAPVRGADVRLEGNMNHAGMVPVFADAAEAAPGRYESPFEFTMGGDWFVVVSADLPDGRALERVVRVPGVLAGRSACPVPAEQGTKVD